MSLAGTLILTAALQTQAVQVQLHPNSLTLPVDSSATLSYTAADSTGARVSLSGVRWLSLDAEIVTVDQRGRVTGRKPGQTRVAVLVGGRPTFATITVPELPVASLEVGAPTVELAAGTSVPLSVTGFNRLGDPVDAPPIAFESDAPAVARVDEKGRVFARSPGRAEIRARSGSATTTLTFRIGPRTDAQYRITPGGSTVRTGDVVRFRVESSGATATLYPAWGLDASGASIDGEGASGVFVAEEPGDYRVTALIGEREAAHTVVRVVQRHIPARLELVGRGPAATHHSGDTWAFEGVDGRDYAYIGTFMHDWMKVWDVTDPANTVLTDSIQLDARRINDVKIHPNNRIGIVTREGASSRRNGIVLLDLSTPAHPTILSEYTETVTGGVHNVWIEPNDMVYAAHNGTSEMHIIDISDPRTPREVGRWGLDKQAKTLHDIIVQDGYAYLSYWDDGIVMLDVGAGTHGGTPTNPAFVSQYAYPIGNTHVAWRAGRYLFVGDEIFPSDWDADAPIEARGYIHVVDYGDPEHPVEVARYEVPEAGAHNVWVAGDRLYVGYYQAGLRVVDISGELRGDLYRQGREIAVIKTTDANTTVPNWPMTWGAQLFKGNIFTSDLNSGLWILRLDEEVIVP